MPSSATWPMTDALHDHWTWRPEWSSGRPCLYWYLTFDGEHLAGALGPEILDAVKATDWLDPVPPRWMHLTLWDLGFADELDQETVRTAATTARRLFEDHPPIRLVLGPVRTLTQAMVLTAGPLDDLRDLQARVRQVTERTAGSHGYVPGGLFWPHVSLGYVNREVDRRTVARTVDRMPRVLTHVEVDRLTLASVTRRNRHYQWNVAAEVDLRSHRAMAASGSAGR